MLLEYLADMMEKGASYAPKCLGHFVVPTRDHMRVARTCALGAIAHGILGREALPEEVDAEAERVKAAWYDALVDRVVAGELPREALPAAVIYQNDRSPLSREAIAARLRVVAKGK